MRFHQTLPTSIFYRLRYTSEYPSQLQACLLAGLSVDLGQDNYQQHQQQKAFCAGFRIKVFMYVRLFWFSS